MPRDRLTSLRRVIQRQRSKSYRFRSRKRNHDQASFVDSTVGHELQEMEEEPPDPTLVSFLEEVEVIRDLLKSFNEDIDFIKRKHEDSLASPNYSADAPRRKELDDCYDKINLKSINIRSKLKQMEIAIRGETAGSSNRRLSPSQIRIMLTQHNFVLKLFTDSIQEYHLAQSKYRDDCKKKIKRQLEISGTVYDDDEIEERLETGNWLIFTQGIVTETADAKKLMEGITARHDDILHLEKSIKDLHDLFLELSFLCESQGDLVDRIETQVNEAKYYVEDSNVTIRTANRHYKKFQKKKFIIVALLIIFAIILGIILYVSLRP